MTIPLAPRPARSTRRSETRDIVQPIIRALNRLPFARVTRNANLGPVVPWGKRHDPNARPIVSGLGAGSADLVGIVPVLITPEMVGRTLGVALALEVKLPADRARKLAGGTVEPDQVRWLAAFRRLGGYAAVVRSIEEAVAAVVQCSKGELP